MEEKQKQTGHEDISSMLSGTTAAVGGAVVAFGAVLFILIILNYFNVLKLPFLPKGGWVTQPKDLPTQVIERCSVRAKDHSLVYDVTDTGKVITGQYRGTIDNISNAQDGSLNITIRSDDGKEKHTFHIDKTIPLDDAIHAKKITITDLQAGQYVEIGFNCNKLQGNQFFITSIDIQQK